MTKKVIVADIKMLPADDADNSVKLGVFQDTGNLVRRDDKDIPRGIPLHVYLVYTENTFTRCHVYVSKTQTVEELTPELYNQLRSEHQNVQKVLASTDTKLKVRGVKDKLLDDLVHLSRGDAPMTMRVNLLVEVVCESCGEPEINHNYRHPFSANLKFSENEILGK